MGFFDTFKGKQYKSELEELQSKYDEMQQLLTPEMKDAIALQDKIRELNLTIYQKQDAIGQLDTDYESKVSAIDRDMEKKQKELSKLDDTIKSKKSEIINLDDEILVQEFGLYKPSYEFASALDYKEELAKIRARQKDMIKNKLAVSGSTDWQVNGSSAKGKKMVNDTQKLLLRAFNTECDELVSKVKYTNFDAYLNRIYKSAEAISKLGTIMNISIRNAYLDLKVKELRLAFEYQQKKQEEKEAQRAARAEMREAARLQKEIEAQVLFP